MNGPTIATRNMKAGVSPHGGKHGHANVLIRQNEKASDVYGTGNRWLSASVFVFANDVAF